MTTTTPASKPEPTTLLRDAEELLAEALALMQAPRSGDRRGLHRELLARAIGLAEEAFAAGGEERVARRLLAVGHGARAEDARHGANQLSLSAQRAPTCEDCDAGWRQVEELAKVAEEAASASESYAAGLGAPTRTIARRAAAAGRDARRLVDERNRAFRFHADPGWSFGEGWYVAAAALLGEVEIQLVPGEAHFARAETFLRDAGLSRKLVPYKPRPPANKPLPELIARRFREDPDSARRRLRAAFLGDEPPPPAVVDWTRAKLRGAPRGKKLLLWVRYGRHQPERNTNHEELVELSRMALAAGLVPMPIGDAVGEGGVPPGAIDLTLFWKEPEFQGIDQRRAQLQLFELLREAYGLVGQVGVTTAGMDGPALMGLPTMYLTDAPNPRLGSWVGAVPDYVEVVRTEGYLERIGHTLRSWSGR